MSVKATNWAWEQRMPPTNKLILMALADIANEVGECWPNVKTIARMSCVSDRTVRRTMKVFEACSALLVIPRFTSSGRQTSNRYRLALNTYPVNLSPSLLAEQEDGDAVVSPPLPRLRQARGDTAPSHLEPPKNHLEEPPQQPSGNVELRIPAILDGTRRDSVMKMLAVCPAVQRQSVLDEVAGWNERNQVRRPIGLLRALINAAAAGTFTPNAAIDYIERQQRLRRDQQATEMAKVTDAPSFDGGTPSMKRPDLTALRNKIIATAEARRSNALNGKCVDGFGGAE